MAVINGRMIGETNGGFGERISDPACSPVPSRTRGACPSLARPMPTGDGLLVRFRPVTAGLSIRQYRQLAEAAVRHGNGLLEVTARGSLQLRGLRPETVSTLEIDMDRAGIAIESGVTIETPPLSGLDPLEIADARAMAARLRLAIGQMTPQPILAPKLSIIVDGGGLLGLDPIPADIRLMAKAEAGKEPIWDVAIGGTRQTARELAALPAREILPVVTDLLQALAKLGPRARGRDLDADGLILSLPLHRVGRGGEGSTANISAIGVHHLGNRGSVLGLRLSYGQIRSAELIAFLDVVERCGAGEIRTAPGHALLILGLDPAAMADVKLAAANYGLYASIDDPRHDIDVCAGAGACASAFYETKAVAAQLLEQGADLLDGSIGFHLSGCSKGCAHPARTGIAIVGTPMGYGLVVNGSASDEPIAYIHRNDLKSALSGIARMVRDEKGAGESAGACLTRLGGNEIARVLRQG